MNAAFVRAAIPEPVTCLGVRLRDFSTGHFIWLASFQSPFLYGHRPADPQDLMKAVIVCANEYKDIRRAFTDSDLSKDLRKWQRKLKGSMFSRKFWKPYNFTPATELFQKYVDASGAGNSEASRKALPCIASEIGNERDVESPWPAITLATLMAKLHCDFDTAVNMPLPLAKWLCAAFGESEGLVTVKDREKFAALKAEADAIAAEVLRKGKA